jgi:hypothetical protein
MTTTKVDHDEQIKTLTDQIEQIEQERDGYSAACHQAEQAERLIREELDDVQRENIRLKGWQDCAREILMRSHPSTSNHELRVVK